MFFLHSCWLILLNTLHYCWFLLLLLSTFLLLPLRTFLIHSWTLILLLCTFFILVDSISCSYAPSSFLLILSHYCSDHLKSACNTSFACNYFFCKGSKYSTGRTTFNFRKLHVHFYRLGPSVSLIHGRARPRYVLNLYYDGQTLRIITFCMRRSYNNCNIVQSCPFFSA